MSTRLATAPPSAGLTPPNPPSSPLSTISTGVGTTPSVAEEPFPGMQPDPGSHHHLLACLPPLLLILILWIPRSPNIIPTTTLSPSLPGKSSLLTSCSTWPMSQATLVLCPGCPRTSSISTTKPWLPPTRTPTRKPSPGSPRTDRRDRKGRKGSLCHQTIWKRGWEFPGWEL